MSMSTISIGSLYIWEIAKIVFQMDPYNLQVKPQFGKVFMLISSFNLISKMLALRKSNICSFSFECSSLLIKARRFSPRLLFCRCQFWFQRREKSRLLDEVKNLTQSAGESKTFPVTIYLLIRITSSRWRTVTQTMYTFGHIYTRLLISCFDIWTFPIQIKENYFSKHNKDSLFPQISFESRYRRLQNVRRSWCKNWKHSECKWQICSETATSRSSTKKGLRGNRSREKHLQGKIHVTSPVVFLNRCFNWVELLKAIKTEPLVT